MRHRPGRDRQSGITLLEIMFAVIILAAAMIPIASMIGFGFKGTMKDYRNIVALQLLESTLNQVQSAEYDAIPDGNHTTTLVLIATDTNARIPLGNIASGGYTFNVSLNVAAQDVTFSYQSVLYNQPGFNENNPATWQFSGVQTVSYNQASGLFARRVRRVEAIVNWTEPNTAPRTVRAVTFKVRMRQS